MEAEGLAGFWGSGGVTAYCTVRFIVSSQDKEGPADSPLGARNGHGFFRHGDTVTRYFHAVTRNFHGCGKFLFDAAEDSASDLRWGFFE